MSDLFRLTEVQMEHLRPFSPKSRGRPSWGRVIRYPRIAVVRQGTNSTCNERQEGPRCGHLAQEHAARCTNGRSGEAAAQHQIDRRAAAKGRPRPRLYAAGAKYRDLKRGWLGLRAAVRCTGRYSCSPSLRRPEPIANNLGFFEAAV